MKKIAIIGTAGRGEDASRLTAATYLRMIDAAKHVIKLTGAEAFISGGAAWADHVAFDCGLPGIVYLPADAHDLRTAEYYHSKFSEKIETPTWSEVLRPPPNIAVVKMGTFKSRNLSVAREADTFIAMTFGLKHNVKDGGTRHTVNAMRAKGISGYHLDLNTLKLYRAT